MIVLSGKNITKSYGIETIIENITFTVQDNDKIGIVGMNGAGKSTLFKIITGVLEKDSGEIYTGRNMRLGYMSQDFDFESDNSIWDEMLTVFAPIIQMEQTMQELESKISRVSGSEDMDALELLLKNYANLQDKYKQADGFAYQSQIKGVLKGLGFDQEEYDKKVCTLSGGQKTRIALGKILLQRFDILLLDEPTNYLDIASVEWLEGYLKLLNSAVLIVSHDRYFLDMVTNKTFEIENKLLTEYNGNYSKFTQLKEALREQLQKDYEQQQKEIARQEAIIARYRQYNREKSIIQAESREKALDRMEKIDKPNQLPRSAHFRFEPQIKSGNDILFVEDLSKSYDHQLFRNISMAVKQGEKVALLGPNGIGKTTMLKIIAGEVVSDSGSIRLGKNVFVGYYEQEHESLDYSKTVIDEIWDTYPHLNQTEIRSKLAAFLFQGDDVFKEISKLSGGERSRIALLKLMLSKCNFLLMDEPTNHLDVLSKEVLENALLNYTGTVLLISHDRYFINKVATRIVDLTPTDCISYPGNYGYYLFKKEQLKAESIQESDKQPQESATELKSEWMRQKEERSSQKKQQKRLETIEKDIEKHELRINEIKELLETPEVFSDHIKCQALNQESEDLKAILDALYEEWDELL